MRKWKTRPISGSPRIGIVVATFQQDSMLRGLAASLQSQTYPRFCALAVHDGPAEEKYRKSWPTDDPRFEWDELPERQNKFGHPNRRHGFAQLAGRVDYICNTNGDCWYTPVYFEALLHCLQSKQADFAYCNMIHSHRQWSPLPTSIGRARIDTGCWMAKAGLLFDVLPLWTSDDFAADWTLIEKIMSKKPKVVKEDGFHYVHN
jgi:hypothetical protein